MGPDSEFKQDVYILGITDSHHAAAALIKNGAVIAAIEEERINRIKGWRGFPLESIKTCLKMGNIQPEDVDLITVGGRNTPNALVRHPKIFSWVISHRKQIYHQSGFLKRIYIHSQILLRAIPFGQHIAEIVSRYFFKKMLFPLFKKTIPPIIFYDHHRTHAYAYFVSGFDKALTITIDNQGDGLSSGVFACEGDSIKRISYCNAVNSVGYFYNLITSYLGFNHVTDVGKTVGLAAYGNPACYDLMRKRLNFISEQGTITCTVGLGLFSESPKKLFKQLDQFSREDVAASVQKLVEDVVTAYVEYYARKTGHRNMVLNGGVAYNIKINQRIKELDCVDDLFIFPAAGDNGLAILSAIEGYQLYVKKKLKNRQIKHVFLGPAYTNEDIKKALDIYEDQIVYRLSKRVDDEVADLIAQGHIVWRFQGRLEFGPRALGHRSIVALPNKHDIVDIINKKLGRDHFMPMCPTILAERSGEYVEGLNSIKAPFMIISFNVKMDKKDRIPAVVHVDNTMRPQFLEKAIDPRYWQIIAEVERKTGFPLVLNTSFNRHGEPIVCSPEDAISSFIASDGEYLALEDYIITIKKA
ncbi:MAG: carbamoyltransferase C-terminal domain-containing protein [bacterium]